MGRKGCWLSAQERQVVRGQRREGCVGHCPTEREERGNSVLRYPLIYLEHFSIGAMAQAAEPLEVLLEKGFWPAWVIPRTLQGL